MEGETCPETNTKPSQCVTQSERIGGLSLDVVSRHIPPSSAGEVLPGLWVGNLMSVSHLGDLIQNSTLSSGARSNPPNNTVIITAISVLSNPNLVRLAADFLEKQRLRYANISQNNCNHLSLDMNIHHVVISLKDTADSDLLSVLPNALAAIDEALGDATSNTTAKASPQYDTTANIDNRKSAIRNNGNDDNSQRICLVHCAKGASRSVSVIVAYLLSRHSRRFKTFDEALGHARTVRPKALPNIGFALALRKFERQLLGHNK